MGAVSEKSMRWQVQGALVIAVCAISFAALFFRAAAPTHPLVQACTRLLLSAVFLCPFLFRHHSIFREDIPARNAAIGCGVWYAIHFGAWVTSLTLTSVAASVTLVTATPLVLGLVGWVRGVDAPSGSQWKGLAVGCLGIGVIGWGDFHQNSSALVGDLLALVGAVGMAGYLYTCRPVIGRVNVLAFTAVATGVGGVLLLLACLAAGIPFTIPGWAPFLALVAAALFPQLVGHVLLTWASRKVAPVTVGTATLGEPVGAATLAFVFLGEVPTTVVVVGSVLALVGMIVVFSGGAAEEKRA